MTGKSLFVLSACFIIGLKATPQSVALLGKAARRGEPSSRRSFIYGEFIQRSDWSSGGKPQFIAITDTVSKASYRFNVKPAFKSARRNSFVVSVPPGVYTILSYQWSQYQYTYDEPIFNGVAINDELVRAVALGHLNPDTLKRFVFNVMPNSLQYAGTWHFEKRAVYFTDDKDHLDLVLAKRYSHLNFQAAQKTLPR